jgi:hypothetical protein
MPRFADQLHLFKSITENEDRPRHKLPFSTWAVGLTMALVTAFPAAAGSRISRGEALVKANCARCHAVGRSDESRHPDAPPFRTLSQRYPLQDGEIKQRGGKVVTAYAVQADFDPATLVSNTFQMEWPPGSGRMRPFPEIDRVQWFTLADAEAKILPGQAGFLDRLAAGLPRIRLDPQPLGPTAVASMPTPVSPAEQVAIRHTQVPRRTTNIEE